MCRLFAFLAALAVAAFSHAAPFAQMDLPTAQDATHCQLAFCNATGGACAAYGANVPVTGAPKICRVDVASAAPGAQSVRMKAVVIDATWGNLTSPESAHFPFTRPAAPGAPSGGALVP